MAADFTIKQGDVLPVLNDTLTYSDGSAVNLTSATVKFIMRSLTATLPTVNTTATVVSATAGTVKYSFTPRIRPPPGAIKASGRSRSPAANR